MGLNENGGQFVTVSYILRLADGMFQRSLMQRSHLEEFVGLRSTPATLASGKSKAKSEGIQSSFHIQAHWEFFYDIWTSYPDKVRGVLNEGGLYGERLGWHLPGYDTSAWDARDLSDGLPNVAAGVGFFVTTFDLNISEELDVPMSFTFDRSFQPYRAQLYVNGWMMGKRVANLGQVHFRS
jgi:hypothetical protein